APKPAASKPVTPAAAKDAGFDDVALDAIAAMVNDEPILASDVEEQLFQFVQRAQIRPDSAQVDTLRRQVLEQLIDDKVILLEAKRQAITVNPAEVNKQVEAAIADAKQRLGGEQAFAEQLARENITEERLRERFKTDAERQMLGQRVVQKSIPRRTVPQAEAEAWFQAHKDKFPKVPPQLRLQVIQLVPAPDSVTLAAAKAKIESVRKRILAGEKFAKLAADVSDDQNTSKSGGDLGFFRRGQMETALEDAAFALPESKLSAAVRSPYGWHLIEVMERDTVRSPAGKDSLDANGLPIVEVHARHIVVKVTPNDADIDRTFETAKKVREQAAKGGDYGALVKRYSNYQGQATPDGDIGFVSLSVFSPNIRGGIADLKPGEVSEVLPNAQGFNIFKIVDRKPEREYEVAEIKEELPEAVAQAQFKEKYDAWVKTLRAKAQIEYRNL
ncbi:MAG: peptidylprolyl isomerase, partial [Candidatus Eisenbacteria bacterium]